MGLQGYSEKAEAARYDGANIVTGIGGIISINADTTPAQILNTNPGVPNITISDLGGGVHQFTLHGAVDNRATPPGTPQTVLSGVETVVAALNYTVGGPGLWLFFANASSATVLNNTTTWRMRMLNGAAQMASITGTTSPSTNIKAIDMSLAPGTLNLAGGENISTLITVDLPVDPSMDFDCTFFAIFLGL